MMIVGVALAAFTVSLFQPAPVPAPVQVQDPWPQVTRCSVVMPEDLDRTEGN
jgi:hypothetical protein